MASEGRQYLSWDPVFVVIYFAVLPFQTLVNAKASALYLH
jgi:hypothetical protein